LLGGGGVDGAIHQKAGPKLLEECKGLGGCKTSQAKATKAYNLDAKWIIHTVGPVWKGGQEDEEKLLYDSYENSLKLADELKAKTIAFPAISTGIYGFPKEKYALIELKAIKDFMKNNKNLKEVRLVCFSKKSFDLHKEAKKKEFL
jgi:O-acetyl-ADP-ribose deacetylase (regulator of RNase III)